MEETIMGAELVSTANRGQTIRLKVKPYHDELPGEIALAPTLLHFPDYAFRRRKAWGCVELGPRSDQGSLPFCRSHA